MSTHPHSHPHAAPRPRPERAPFDRGQLVGAGVAAFVGLLLSPVLSEALVVLAGVVLVVAGLGSLLGWGGARLTGVLGGALLLGTVPYWVAATVVVLTRPQL